MWVIVRAEPLVRQDVCPYNKKSSILGKICDFYPQIPLRSQNWNSLNLKIDDESMAKIERLKELVESSQSSTMSYTNCLLQAVEFYLNKKDPVLKAKKHKEKAKSVIHNNDQQNNKSRESKTIVSVKKNSVKKVSLKSSASHEKPKREPIPAAVRHELFYKYQGQYPSRDSFGRLCESRRFLQVHHKIQ